MTDARAAATATWCLTCRDVTIRRGGRLVLQDIRFELRPGQCVSVIGPNGSGKTTLLLALLGLLPPESGAVELNGVPIRRLGSRQRGRLAAYVPQVVERIPAFRVYDVVAGGRFPHLAPLRPLGPADHDAIDAALRRCGLTDLAQRPVNAVSGGERQKALLAAAIAQDAELLFLDEPSTALDPAVQVELIQLLRDWHARGRGLVLVSHDLNLPAVLGGRVIALQSGRLAADGPVEEVLQPNRLEKIYGTQFEALQTPNGQRLVVPRW
jgi:iron complex transport system ATP-binding protein